MGFSNTINSPDLQLRINLHCKFVGCATQMFGGMGQPRRGGSGSDNFYGNFLHFRGNACVRTSLRTTYKRVPIINHFCKTFGFLPSPPTLRQLSYPLDYKHITCSFLDSTPLEGTMTLTYFVGLFLLFILVLFEPVVDRG